MEPINTDTPETDEGSEGPADSEIPFTPKLKVPETSGGKKPPNPTMVFVLSLFGYPGVGHFMVGSKALGAAVVVVFTGLTVGVLYEMWILLGPLYKLYTQGTPMENAPNWARIVFWVVSTGIVWLGSGLHSFFLARKLQS